MAASPWASIKAGDNILSEVHFNTGFELDISQPLDGTANPGGILGTAAGFETSPFNFTYDTTGQFKVGRHLQMHQTYPQHFNYPLASDQTNLEPMHLVHFYGNHTSVHGPVNPDPMSFFEKRNGVFVMHARRVEESEKSWCRIKGYATMESGKEATWAWFNARGGVPMDWGPYRTTPPPKVQWNGTTNAIVYDSSGNQVPNLESAVYFYNMPAQYACTMVSTYNRCSMSFGRDMARVMMPLGAKSAGVTTNRNNIEVWFPAFWSLEDVPARCDLNGRVHNLDTYTPGNPGADGVLNELDSLELFGYTTATHVTSHHYLDGYDTRIQRNHGTQQSATAYGDALLTVHAAKNTFIEVGVDRFPPYQGKPGLIAYHMNGKYVATYEMPDYLGQPKINYEPRSDQPWVPLKNADGTIKRNGSQRYGNGDPAYTHWCQIFNIAMSAGFLRGLAVTNLDTGLVPAFSESEEYHIAWTRMSPLKQEYGNPDSRAFINYSGGDTNDISNVLGPTYERFSTGYNNSGHVDLVPPDVIETGTPNYVDIITKYGEEATRPNGGKVYFRVKSV